MGAALRVVREKLGDDVVDDLQMFVERAGREWRDDVLSAAAERFERRMGHEIGTFRLDVARELAAMRVDVAKELAAMRIDTAKEFAALRVEMAAARVSLLKWSFVFWVGQFTAMTAMMAFMFSRFGVR